MFPQTGISDANLDLAHFLIPSFRTRKRRWQPKGKSRSFLHLTFSVIRKVVLEQINYEMTSLFATKIQSFLVYWFFSKKEPAGVEER